MKKYAVIVAGGSGSRMKSDIPKQFLVMAGKPILMHTLEAFHACDSSIEIVLVLPNDAIAYWEELLFEYDFDVPHTVAQGGKTRSDSVYNGLTKIADDGLVAIHDGARPLVTLKVINEAYQMASKKGNAVAAVPLKDSLRQEVDGGNISVDRSMFHLIQTPQTFKLDLIKDAFANRRDGVNYTDDASVLEDAGSTINLSEGDYENIKITTAEDLVVGEALLISRK